MPIRQIPGLAIALLLLASCGPEKADVIYHGGLVWTGDSSRPTATVVALKGDRILYVGDDPDAVRGPQTRIIDLPDALIVPGFIDNHTHFLLGGYSLAGVQLKPVRSREAFIQSIARFCRTDTGTGWIRGGDWDHEAMGGELPSRDWIDSVTGDRPVLVTRYDGHMALANSRALALAGIGDDTPDPRGGVFGRDAQGRLTGIVRDEAMALVAKAIPPYSAAQLDAFLDRAMDHALRHGVTEVDDMGYFGGWREWDTYRRADREGRLRLRVYSFLPLHEWQRLDSLVRREGRGTGLHRWGGLKGFVDGSLGSTTAWFHEPYRDDPGSRGLQVTDTNDIRQWVLGADAAGLHVTCHAIGDRANDFILDVYTAAARRNGPRDRRFRVEHAQHLSPAAIARFARLGVIPSMQPFHLVDDGIWAGKRLDSTRLRGTYAFRSLLTAGAGLTFGSDWTVAPLDPLAGIDAAVNRRTGDGRHPGGWFPDEKITVEQALAMYTAHNAYAGFRERERGRIRAGLQADMAVLDRNILRMPVDSIRSARVIRTIVAGREAFVR